MAMLRDKCDVRSLRLECRVTGGFRIIFILAALGPSRLVADSIPKVYWATVTDTVLRRANLDGTHPEDVFRTPGGEPPILGVDLLTASLFVPSVAGGGIQAVTVDGQNPHVAIQVSEYVTSLDIDSRGRLAYWAESAVGNSIWRGDLDGGERQLLFKNLPLVTAIEVDSEAGAFYWTDLYTGAIRRTVMLGLVTETIFDEAALGDTPLSTGLAIDGQSGFLYSSDSAFNAILRMRLDGSEATKFIVEGVVSPQSIALDTKAHRIYWSNSSGFSNGSTEYDYYVMSAKLDGTDVRKEFVPLTPWGLADTAIDLNIVCVSVPEPEASWPIIAAMAGMAIFTRMSCRRSSSNPSAAPGR